MKIDCAVNLMLSAIKLINSHQWKTLHSIRRSSTSGASCLRRRQWEFLNPTYKIDGEIPILYTEGKLILPITPVVHAWSPQMGNDVANWATLVSYYRCVDISPFLASFRVYICFNTSKMDLKQIWPLDNSMGGRNLAQQSRAQHKFAYCVYINTYVYCFSAARWLDNKNKK